VRAIVFAARHPAVVIGVDGDGVPQRRAGARCNHSYPRAADRCWESRRDACIVVVNQPGGLRWWSMAIANRVGEASGAEPRGAGDYLTGCTENGHAA